MSIGRFDFMIRLAAFADEASPRVEGQIAALLRNGMQYIELRGLDGKNISQITEEEAHRYAKIYADAGIKVWSIGSPIGKVDIGSDLEAHRNLLRHVCRLANIFGTTRIRMFSFYKSYECEERVMDELSAMVDIAKEYGVTLCHENEKQIFGDTLERVLKIRESVDGLCHIYDPANFLECDQNAESTLNALHAGTDYFHIKDVVSSTGELVPAGYGDGMIDKLVAMIPADADKTLTIEPHLAIFAGYSEIDNTEMKNKFHFASNDEAFDAAVNAIKQVLLSQGYRAVDGGYAK